MRLDGYEIEVLEAEDIEVGEHSFAIHFHACRTTAAMLQSCHLGKI